MIFIFTDDTRRNDTLLFIKCVYNLHTPRTICNTHSLLFRRLWKFILTLQTIDFKCFLYLERSLEGSFSIIFLNGCRYRWKQISMVRHENHLRHGIRWWYLSRLSYCYSQLSRSVARGTRPVEGSARRSSLFFPSGRSDRIASWPRVEQGSMVRSARILRVTRVAARLDCLQRLSNAARVYRPGKTNTCETNWCKISRFALCRFVPRIQDCASSLGIFLQRLR